MPRSMLVAIGGLLAAVLLGILGLNAGSASPGLGAALLGGGFGVSGGVALMLLAGRLRAPASRRNAAAQRDPGTGPVARVAVDTAQARPALDPPAAVISPPARGAPGPGVSALEPVGLLAAVEGILDDASAHPLSASASTAAASTTAAAAASADTDAAAASAPDWPPAGASPEPAAPAGRDRGSCGSKPTTSPVTIRPGVAESGSRGKAPLAPSALLDTLQHLHEDELLAAAVSDTAASPPARQ